MISWKKLSPLLILCGLLLFRSSKVKKLLELLLRPTELRFALQYLLFKRTQIPKGLPSDDQFCFRMLTKVSRSFSAVILELHDELKTAVCIFYLVLRGLDTIEDDMKIPVEKKVKLLKEFSGHLEDPSWNSREGYGASNPDEQALLEGFDRVTRTYSKLKPKYKETIKDITERMANGMSDFLTKKVESYDDYELYCHYVAGLVGIGLSKLFHHSGLEGDRFSDLDTLSNSMGLFLQKTNIIRDFLEDVVQQPPRVFYPKEIWSKYASKVEDLKEPKNIEQAVECLNHMVTDALKHIPDCIDYMALITEPSVFRFCAIPQVMAIATLERCYNNPAVFSTQVKIRKGEAVKLIYKTTHFDAACGIFSEYIGMLSSKIQRKDPSAERTRALINVAKDKIMETKMKSMN